MRNRDLKEWNGMPTDRAFVLTRPLLPHGGRLGGSRRRAPGDDGFSLIEVLVALAVIGTVMAGTAPFLVKSVALLGQQRTQQVAIEVANDALERARALTPSSLLAGRSLLAAQSQLTSAPATVQSALAGTLLEGDPLGSTIPGAGIDAPLPTQPLAVTVGGVEYQQNWYVGSCWQPKAKTAAVSDCVATKPAVDAVQFFRVVVAVTWQHNSCETKPGPQPPRPANECVYIASTLVSPGSDPVFDLKRPPPTISGPGNQAGYSGVAVSFQLVASGGTLPRSWSLTGLPAGLAVSTSGLITGTPTTPGTYPVTVHVQDRDGKTDDSTFTWTVAQPPALTAPSTQTSRTGTAVSLPVAVTGGLLPLVWSATGLPAGLSINASTGVISGTPTTTGTRTPTVTVVDNGNQTASVSFSWRVLTPVALANPGSFSATQGDPGTYNLAPLASGGLAPYTWQATNLPLGLALNASTGAVTGTVANGTRYLVTVEVTDSAGGTASVTALVNVAHRNATDLRVTAPNPTSPDQTTAVGALVSLTATAAGTSGYTWSATGLPPGLAFSSAGALTGRPTAAGTYVVTLTVTDSGARVAKLMLTWRVTP
jgi:prepilin-type N-terminal cleavage/methylation domain-containing protein